MSAESELLTCLQLHQHLKMVYLLEDNLMVAFQAIRFEARLVCFLVKADLD